MQTSPRLVVPIDAKLHKALKIEAAKRDSTMSALVLDAVKRHVLKQPAQPAR